MTRKTFGKLKISWCLFFVSDVITLQKSELASKTKNFLHNMKTMKSSIHLNNGVTALQWKKAWLRAFTDLQQRAQLGEFPKFSKESYLPTQRAFRITSQVYDASLLVGHFNLGSQVYMKRGSCVIKPNSLGSLSCTDPSLTTDIMSYGTTPVRRIGYQLLVRANHHSR